MLSIAIPEIHTGGDDDDDDGGYYLLNIHLSQALSQANLLTYFILFHPLSCSPFCYCYLQQR